MVEVPPKNPGRPLPAPPVSKSEPRPLPAAPMEPRPLPIPLLEVNSDNKQEIDVKKPNTDKQPTSPNQNKPSVIKAWEENSKSSMCFISSKTISGFPVLLFLKNPWECQ